MPDVLHTPVMLQEVLETFSPVQSQGAILDATFGAGGHSRALLEAGAQVVAIDQDPLAQTLSQQLQHSHFRFIQGNFRAMDSLLPQAGIDSLAGVLMDLGLSSMQIDEAERGFAFRQDGPLDMRMHPDGQSAADVVNTLETEKLAAILYKYGEERHSRRIARGIVQARETQAITRTDTLVDIIRRAYPPGKRHDHPARRSFQALRIYVNDELGALEQGLEAASRLLIPGGVIVVISYHSLEDRIVKHYFRQHYAFKPQQKRPRNASEIEIQANPRARSAKFRSAWKLGASEDTP